MRIDAHHHVWDLRDRPQPWTDDLPVLRRSFRFSELATQLAEAEVDGTVVVHTVADPDETRDLLALAAAEPLVLGVVGWFDLEAPDLDETVAAARELPGGRHLVGARHQLQVEPDKAWLDRPAVRRGLRVLARHGLVWDLVVSPEQLPAVTRAVAELPEVSFVLDHAGKPPIARGDLTQWRADLTALAALENVAVKLSGLVTEASWSRWRLADLQPAADTVLDRFGAARTMVGSDWPVCLLAGAEYELVASIGGRLVAGLSDDERAEVEGGTAARWYDLESA
ncbi:amidohydrolase family protein [Nocardioides mangrovi]|uniref:Amidohydrolase family protein n=1 Tax=Nocardioides mangrovi TaxID=2874580 RepID=A0ABS7UJC0_9ACTN|nr:amidohydrolase family protein [Nocardioides mangrovi]MBZ5740977.1 amidohydrolase family protein [Nocardioides mangrovi]